MRGNSCLLRPSPSLWEYLSSTKTWLDSISPQLLSLVNSISIVYICSMTFTSPCHSIIHVQIVTVDPVFHIHVLYLYTMYMFQTVCVWIVFQIGNLKQLHVHCGRPDVLITRSYGEFLVHQATGGISGVTTSKPSLVFAGNDIDQNMVYFFLPKYVLLQSHCSDSPKDYFHICTHIEGSLRWLRSLCTLIAGWSFGLIDHTHFVTSQSSYHTWQYLSVTTTKLVSQSYTCTT